MHLDDFNEITNKIIELEKCKLIVDSYHDEDGRLGVTLKKVGGSTFTKLDSIKHSFYKNDGFHLVILL